MLIGISDLETVAPKYHRRYFQVRVSHPTGAPPTTKPCDHNNNTTAYKTSYNTSYKTTYKTAHNSASGILV